MLFFIFLHPYSSYLLGFILNITKLLISEKTVNKMLGLRSYTFYQAPIYA